MVIEEIINELDKFITKYKERKSSEEKGISLRNNIKQALIEKGIQGANTLDDSDIVKRIKTLSSSGNTAVGGIQGNNSVNDSFAQKVIQILKDKHYPFLNSSEDSLSSFTKFIENRKIKVGELLKRPRITINGNSLDLEIVPNEGFSVKVNYVSNNILNKEVIHNKKTIQNVSKISYQECDYYGATGEEREKTIYLEPYKKQIEHPENYIFSGDDNGGNEDTIAFLELIDNSNYDILDFSDNSFYLSIASKKAKEIDSRKDVTSELSYSIRKFSLNGTIKVGVIKDDDSSFGLSNTQSDSLKNYPKYLVVPSKIFLGYNRVRILNNEITFEEDYNSSLGTDVWNQIRTKAEETGEVIFRWDSGQKKYMFEAAEKLENWLKTHPIETL